MSAVYAHIQLNFNATPHDGGGFRCHTIRKRAFHLNKKELITHA